MLMQVPGEMLGINMRKMLSVCIWKTMPSKKHLRCNNTSSLGHHLEVKVHSFALLLFDIVYVFITRSREYISQTPKDPESQSGISAVYYEVIMALLGVYLGNAAYVCICKWWSVISVLAGRVTGSWLFFFFFLPSCFGPWWSEAYMMWSRRPGTPRCACPLRGRSGSMCVEAHYLATDAAAGRAEKKRISPGFLKSNDLSRLTAD